MAAGIAGLVTVVPPLETIGAVFGIGLIIWFVWIGVLLLKPGDVVATRSDTMTGQNT